MATFVKFWRCDICKARFDNKADALACEAQGDGSGDAPPRGLIVTESVEHCGYRDRGGSHLGPYFGDRFTGVATGKIRQVAPHSQRPKWHWFRGNGCGDDPWSIGGRDDILHHWRRCGDTFLDAPSVGRAVDACRERGIEPLVVHDGRIVPYGTVRPQAESGEREG